MALAYYGGLRKADVVRVPKTARVGGSIDMDMINKNGKELSIFEARRLTAILNEPDDIQMGRAAKDANDVMTLLTIVSAVFLPGVVLAGVMGMNFPLGFYDEPSNFWAVIAAMAVFAVLILGVARWRRWL